MSATTIDQVRLTLSKLRKARSEAEQLFDQIVAENDRAAGEAKRVGQNADTAAYLTNMFYSLGKLAASAHQGMKLAGDALDYHNRQVLSGFVKDKSVHDGTLVANTLLSDVSQGPLVIGKALLKAWNDIQSPSFWAGMYADLSTGGRSFDPVKWADYVEHGRKRAKEEIEARKRQAISGIDKKIRTYEEIMWQMQKNASRAAP